MPKRSGSIHQPWLSLPKQKTQILVAISSSIYTQQGSHPKKIPRCHLFTSYRRPDRSWNTWRVFGRCQVSRYFPLKALDKTKRWGCRRDFSWYQGFLLVSGWTSGYLLLLFCFVLSYVTVSCSRCFMFFNDIIPWYVCMWGMECLRGLTTKHHLPTRQPAHLPDEFGELASVL